MDKKIIYLGMVVGILALSSCERVYQKKDFQDYSNFIEYSESVIPFYLDMIQKPMYFNFHLTSPQKRKEYEDLAASYCKAKGGDFIKNGPWLYCNSSKDEYMIHETNYGFEVYAKPTKQIEEIISKGINLMKSERYQKANEVLKKAYEFAKAVNNKHLIGEAAYYIAYNDFLASKYFDIDKVFKYIRIAKENGINVSSFISDIRIYTQKILNSVLNKAKSGQKQLALRDLSRAFKIAKLLNDNNLLYTTYYYSGNFYLETGDYDKAIEYLQQAIALGQDKPNTLGLLYNLLGQAYEEKGDLPDAEKYYVESSQIALKNGDTEGAAIPLRHLGDIYYQKGNYQKAYQYHLQALMIRGYKTRKGGARYGLDLDLYSVGNDLYKMNQCKDAVVYLDEAVPYLEKFGIYDTMAKALYEDISCYKKLGNNEKAKELFNQYKSILAQQNMLSKFKSLGF
ncbi:MULTISPECIES: tetratricopeptide repeat protein [unclassified Hydrogenobaculum]|uniref:tetratricopeptide repeat protein n=1 Tax=unclassified Hydrogenobaculum TaxID=2622382 RepID=UPI0001C52AC2|nr:MULTISPECIES: tetratricopeptide repeat protein [unclassified Hydrogenobaculum]AEF19052.1 Tetratricopeptide TPR_1 repeat-containing protein [Hydrogenobaculum sp. 3684]AEG46340.1 Tetratricopeptide TPR_1 repeat-containing protein [Hydrogenobaculum sp. SHO]AGG14985.1 Tetratricopeptide TPR_1 repeat-containing protein [Hydrogenobaculum sp. HO]AGH93281.1 tetratricopeptide repeat protein,PPR repeat-containing protein [Hydrogenobaculum sp. SN]